MIYLDHNATAPRHPDAIAAVERVLRDAWANPSSQHRAGQAARRELELGRAGLASLLGAAPADLVICSGGTEADNLAIRGRLAARPERSVVIAPATEHAAIRETLDDLSREPSATIWRELPVDADGLVAPGVLDGILAEPGLAERVAVVSVAWINNETGVAQPIAALGEVCRRHRVAFHVDAVQQAGRGIIDLGDPEFAIDLLTVSPHKFGGPPGVGVLWVRSGVAIAPRMTGGPQEQGRRGGTEDASAVAGAGAAATVRQAWLETADVSVLEARRDRFESELRTRVPDARIVGAGAPRTWNTTCVAVPGLDAETALLMLSEQGVCASAGAACSSGSIEPSPVLLAMGLDPRTAAGAVRFSAGPDTTEAELMAAADAWAGAVEMARVD